MSKNLQNTLKTEMFIENSIFSNTKDEKRSSGQDSNKNMDRLFGKSQQFDVIIEQEQESKSFVGLRNAPHIRVSESSDVLENEGI